MSRITWDQTGEKLYEAGVDHAALYVARSDVPANPSSGADFYGKPKAWNGITAINEGREGGEPNDQYADNIKYISILSEEEFNPTIEAFTYPDEFAECDGSAEVMDGTTPLGMFLGQQKRKMFGLVYRTKIGNDVDDLDHGYKLHICYGLKAQPTERNYETINESPEGMTFSWECSSTKIDPNHTASGTGTDLVSISGKRPVAHIEIDSTKVSANAWSAIEDALYDADNGSLLYPYEVANLIKANPVT